jgi:hypothetical protein
VITSTTIDTTELGHLDGTVTNINTNFTNTSNWVASLRDNKLDKSGLAINRVLTTDATGNVITSTTIDTTELGHLDGTVTNINTNFTNTSNWVASLRDNKLDKSGLAINRVLTTDATGNVITSTTIDTTELGHLDGTVTNINTNFTNTSNWVASLRDNKEPNITVLQVAKGGTGKSLVTASRLIGCITANQYDEIQLGTNLSLSGSVLNASGGTQIQSDWAQATTTSLDFIKNKPGVLTETSRLFNNQGNNHNTYTDFNSIPNFGFWFIQGTTNSPGTNSATQYYLFTQGLGNEFPWSGVGSYGMQIGIPRNVSLPYISIRYKENNVLNSWQKISAGQADKLTTARTINGVSFDGSDNISIPTSDTRWTTVNTNDVYLTNQSGNIGIGTNSPSSKLHVYEASGTPAGANAGTIILDHNNNGGASSITFRSKINIGSDYAYIQYQDATTVGGTGESARFIIGTQNDADDHILLLPSGNVGIGGATTPPVKLYVTGDIAATGNITAYYSDERLKTVTSNIENPLELINKLKGFYYKPNELAHRNGIEHNNQEIGLSAQDLQKVLPEIVKIAPFDLQRNKNGDLVSKSGENYLTVCYERLAPVFVEAIKELTKDLSMKNIEISEIKKELEELKEFKKEWQEMQSLKKELLKFKASLNN